MCTASHDAFFGLVDRTYTTLGQPLSRLEEMVLDLSGLYAKEGRQFGHLRHHTIDGRVAHFGVAMHDVAYFVVVADDPIPDILSASAPVKLGFWRGFREHRSGTYVGT